MLTVRPSQPNRRAFAAWARTVGVGTVSSHDFGVPAALFPAIPDQLLAGAEVDGQLLDPRSRSARSVDAALVGPQQTPEVPQPDGGDGPAPDSTPGPDGPPAAAEGPQPDPGPPPEPVPEPGPEPVPEPVPELEVQAAPEPTEAPPAKAAATHQVTLTCRWCPRTFTSSHGLRTHVGMAHSGQVTAQ